MTDNIETMRPEIAGAVGNPASTCAQSCEGNAYRIEIRRLTSERDALAAKLAELEGREPEAWYDGNKFYANEESASMGCADMDNLRPLYARPIPAEPVNARLLDLLREAEKCISAAVRIEQNAHDEPPCPASEWDYEAYRLAGEICAAIAAAEALGVTGPKRLTDEEIMGLLASIDENSPKDPSFFMIDPLTFARAIEAAVLGVQETKNRD